MTAEREGCCAAWPKPCPYHEGWQDGLDALAGTAAPTVDTVRALLARIDHLLAETQRERDTSAYRMAAAVELLRNAAAVLDGGDPT